ncbi:hypothetical protein ACFXTH_027825 [Malus domestica]
MVKQIFYIDDPKGRKGWEVVEKTEHKGLYDILDRDPAVDDNYVDVANQQLETSMTTGSGGLEIEISIDSIMIDPWDLPRYNVPEHANNYVDMPTDEEEWESEFYDNDDIYSSLDEN